MFRREGGPRIALFTYGTQPRGGVVHALEVADALQRRGVPVTLYGLDDRGTGFFRTPRCPHVLVHFERRPESALDAVRRRIAAYVNVLSVEVPRADVFHAQDGISANALATLVAQGRIPGFVRTVHHLDAFADPELAALQLGSLRAAMKTFVVSAEWQRRLAAEYGIDADLVPNGVDLVRFAPVPAEERARLRAAFGAGDGPLFAVIGGIEVRKNTIAALDAFALVRRTHPTAMLAIAGGASLFDHGAARAAFDARAQELGLRIGAEVRVLGEAGDATIVRLLRAAHALVVPSLMEGFGLVVLEALACETPAVVSRIAPFTDYLDDRSALFVDPRDPASIAQGMLAALDPACAAELALHGRAVASAFSWDASAAVHAQRYAALLGSQSEPTRA